MSDDDLTLVQRATLLTLMIKAGTLPNTFLRNTAKINLEKDYRDRLAAKNLIAVKDGPLVFELTEKGWGRAIEELGADIPAGAGAMGGTLYVLLAHLREYIDRQELSAADLFAADVEMQIRKAYAELAPKPGEYVKLDALRRAIPAGRTSVDAALLRLDREPDVHLVPESNQKRLGVKLKAAAVSIGNQDVHLIAIGS